MLTARSVIRFSIEKV